MKRRTLLLALACTACATTPVPSPLTHNPTDHAVPFTYQVPSRSRTLTVASSSIPLQDRHFGASRGRVTPSTMNGRG